MKTREARTVLLAGGGGGARLAAGMPRSITRNASLVSTIVVANVGDDFEHLGLLICPDTDSVLYSVAGCIDPIRGWGRAQETWCTQSALASLGGPDWFRLGDQDLALHLVRNALKTDGNSPSAITCELAQRLGIHGITICPATDHRLRTRLQTDEGTLDFQTYFVARRCEPKIHAIELDMDPTASPAAPLLAFFQQPVDCVVLGPSNPFLSIAPILDVPGMTDLLRTASRRVAVCPIVDGDALKGPLAKLMVESGIECSALGWCQYMQERYPDLISQWVFDERDIKHRLAIEQCVPDARFLDTVMNTPHKAQVLMDSILAGDYIHV